MVNNKLDNNKLNNMLDNDLFNPIGKYTKSLRMFYITIVLSFLLFIATSLFENAFNSIMSIASFLTWHNLLEFLSILISLGIFLAAYYTYEQTKNLRMMLIGVVFLTMGFIDAFHTLSYKGMPDFFIANDTANRATTFWIIARLVGAVGIFAVCFVDENRIHKIKKHYLVIPAMVVIIVVFFIITYYPHTIPPMYIEGKGLTGLKIILEYIIIAFLICSGFLYLKEYIKTGDSQTIHFSCALVVSIFSEVAFVSYGSVYDIYNYLGHLYKIITYFIFLRTIYIYNIQKPYKDLLIAEENLKHYVQNLDKLVKQRTAELENFNGKLINDLESARTMQLSLLPTNLPDDLSVAFTSRYYPAERLSGDFYNVFKIDNENIVFYIGDVAGHGVLAAILTMFAYQNIKAVGSSENNGECIIKPSDVLQNLYMRFNQTNFSDEMYMVLLYAIYNTKTRKLIYASGGLNATPILIKQGGKVKELDNVGFAICKLAEEIIPDYKDIELKLDKGDKILFYTDGLVEARNSKGSFYSQKTLVKLLSNNSFKDINSLSDSITESIFSFTEKKGLEDDITFVLMDVK